MSRTTLVTVPLLCCLLVSGCGLLDDGPDPEPTAERLAEALADLSLAGVPTDDETAEVTFEELVAPLADLPVEVELTDVAREEEAPAEVESGEGGEWARAVLAWTWETGPEPWRYESGAWLRLAEDAEEWTVEWDPSVLHPELAEGEQLRLETLTAARGGIVGAGGEPIVVERPVRRYGIDKSQLTARQAQASARRLADLLDVDRRAYVAKVKAYGPKAFVEAIVLRDHEADRVPAAFGDVPGAVAIGDELALAPTRDFAAQLLGRVGPATAELIEESEGRIREGDVVGLSGLQARYDEQLAGTRGIRVAAEAPDGAERDLHRVEPERGEDLVTTLDVDLQHRAEAVLEQVGDQASALVAIRPSTGDVLAAANGPGTDLNAATFGQYAPGSTFKVVSALALLRAGREPDDRLPCPATTTVDGRTFTNYDDYPASSLGPITFRTAFAQSCNTAMIDARDALDDGDLAAAAASLGLGVDHDLGFPAYFGQVPEPETDAETERAASMIGQGRVLASPMAMSAVAASVAAGRTVVPQLLPEVAPAPEQDGEPLRRREAEQLRGLMRAVVAEGSGRFLADVGGGVGAKTGTAEFGQPGPDGSLPTHAWMIAFREDLAVAVFVERGASGSATAGPVLEAFLRP